MGSKPALKTKARRPERDAEKTRTFSDAVSFCVRPAAGSLDGVAHEGGEVTHQLAGVFN